jgi:hypothetical protein
MPIVKLVPAACLLARLVKKEMKKKIVEPLQALHLWVSPSASALA